MAVHGGKHHRFDQKKIYALDLAALFLYREFDFLIFASCFGVLFDFCCLVFVIWIQHSVWSFLPHLITAYMFEFNIWFLFDFGFLNIPYIQLQIWDYRFDFLIFASCFGVLFDFCCLVFVIWIHDSYLKPLTFLLWGWNLWFEELWIWFRIQLASKGKIHCYRGYFGHYWKNSEPRVFWSPKNSVCA